MAIYPLPDDVKEALEAALSIVGAQFVRKSDMPALGAGGLSVVDNGDGTLTLSPSSSSQIVDNGDGTLTIA